MSHSLSDLLLRYAQQFEDQHAPQNMTIALREAAKEIERLRAGGCARDQSTTQYCAEAARLAAELHIATEWSAQVHAGQQEDADTIARLTAEVERLTNGRETMGNLWAKERAARVAAEAEVGWLEAALAPEMAEEITNLRAAQSNLIGTNRMLKQHVEDRETTITRLTAENERLRAALGSVMVGGNHLATIIGATHPQTGSHYEAALQFYGPGNQYEAWCCWNAIMQARALTQEPRT
jgi:hypothetical protein